MFTRILSKLSPHEIPRDMVFLALINGLSGMALNGAAIFGMLSVLNGSYFVSGIAGLGCYVIISAVATFVGYATTCRYGAALGLRLRTALYAVFIIHALGFAGAAFIHPSCVALSAGLGLGIFYAVFMLKSINDIEDKKRDSYATLNGVIQQSMSLMAPILGTLMLYAGAHTSMGNPFFMTFLTFALCVLIALPIIRRMPDAPLPCSVVLPIKAIADKRHAPAIGLFLATIFCECLMNPMLIISSFALLGKIIDVGWFAAAITFIAGVSLILSRRIRLPGQRWFLLMIILLGIGSAFGFFSWAFCFSALMAAGGIFGLLRVNYVATWYALASRVMEREWGHFGKNQALVLGEIFVLTARLCAAALLILCGYAGLSLHQSLGIMVIFYILSACISSVLAYRLDRESV